VCALNVPGSPTTQSVPKYDLGGHKFPRKGATQFQTTRFTALLATVLRGEVYRLLNTEFEKARTKLETYTLFAANPMQNL
jgi:hypothetical protein